MLYHVSMIEKRKKLCERLWKASKPLQLLQVVFTILLLGGIWLWRHLINALILSAGRTAITSGDFKYLFTTWQGLTIILVSLGMIMLYLSAVISMHVHYADEVIHQRAFHYRSLLKETGQGMRLLWHSEGVLLLFLTSLLVPLYSIGFSVSLTRQFAVPSFVAFYIFRQKVLLFAYLILVGISLYYLVHWIFVWPCVLIEKESVTEAMRHAERIMHGHIRIWLKEILLLTVFLLVFLGIAGVFVLILPEHLLDGPGFTKGIGYDIVNGIGVFTLCLYVLLLLQVPAVYALRQQELFETFRHHQISFSYQSLSLRRQRVILCLLSACSAVYFSMHFDTYFPDRPHTGIIAHRAGGSMTIENSLEGLRLSIAHGVKGAEVDVQRTKDGHYIINHDVDFYRVYGVEKKPHEMTLEEIEELRASDGSHVPTIEEMLQTAKGNVKLYIEMKGDTADRQMADDLVRIIRSYNMIHETALISLRYNTIKYTEETYPEVETGFLYFASIGDVTDLEADDMMLQERIATASNIRRIHDAGHKAIVWTVNRRAAIHRFLMSDADAIITDKVGKSQAIRQQLKKRTYLERILDAIL